MKRLLIILSLPGLSLIAMDQTFNQEIIPYQVPKELNQKQLKEALKTHLGTAQSASDLEIKEKAFNAALTEFALLSQPTEEEQKKIKKGTSQFSFNPENLQQLQELFKKFPLEDQKNISEASFGLVKLLTMQKAKAEDSINMLQLSKIENKPLLEQFTKNLETHQTLAKKLAKQKDELQRETKETITKKEQEKESALTQMSTQEKEEQKRLDEELQTKLQELQQLYETKKKELTETTQQNSKTVMENFEKEKEELSKKQESESKVLEEQRKLNEEKKSEFEAKKEFLGLTQILFEISQHQEKNSLENEYKEKNKEITKTESEITQIKKDLETTKGNLSRKLELEKQLKEKQATLPTLQEEAKVLESRFRKATERMNKQQPTHSDKVRSIFGNIW